MKHQYCELGNIIENQLISLGQNPAWLAAQCHVTRGQISHIMLGRSRPSIKLLTLISDKLSISSNILIDAIKK